MRNSHEARLWIYDRRIYDKDREFDRPTAPIARPLAPARIGIDGLEAGRYRLEFWDTWAGTVMKTDEIALEKGPLTFDTPPFVSDVACKIGRIETKAQKENHENGTPP